MKLFMLLFLLLSIPLYSETGPEDLTYMTENYPPANYLDEYGILQGASIEILKALWNHMEVTEQPIKLYPWARGYHNIQTKEKQVLFSMSRTNERENLFKWVGPIFTSRHVIVGVQKDSVPHICDTDSSLFKHRIAVIREDVGEQSLLNIGFPADSLHVVSQQKQMIQLLLDNRVEFISLSDEALRDLVKQHNILAKFYIAYTLNIRENFFAFSRDVPDELILQFQNALEAINEKHLKILERSGMELYKSEQ